MTRPRDGDELVTELTDLGVHDETLEILQRVSCVQVFLVESNTYQVSKAGNGQARGAVYGVSLFERRKERFGSAAAASYILVATTALEANC